MNEKQIAIANGKENRNSINNNTEYNIKTQYTMTNINFLSNLIAKNAVNRALAAAKTLRNSGGG